MSLEHSIRLLAGSLILFSLAMTYFVSPWWMLLTAFVGLNLIQSAFSKWCLAEQIFKKTFFKRAESAQLKRKSASAAR